MKLISRKFVLAGFVLGVSAIALFVGVIDGGTWIAASSLALGLYSAGNVLHAKVTAPEEPLLPDDEGEEA